MKGLVRHTIIKVVQSEMWVLWVIYNHRTTKSITVLSSLRIALEAVSALNRSPELTVVRMIPESTGLCSRFELIQERFAWDDRTLTDADGSISPVGPRLEETMPVLIRKENISHSRSIKAGVMHLTYNGSRSQHGRIS